MVDKAEVAKKLSDKQISDRKMIFRDAPDHRVVYANNVAVRITPWDFGFKFGLINEATVEQLITDDHTTIYMSPQHAKAFLDALSKNIWQYEEVFGEIPVPSIKGLPDAK